VTVLQELSHPVVLAPLAGGPSTPELTAAVVDAGGFGFLAAGYLTAEELRERLARIRSLTSGAFGVNVFVPGRPSRRGPIEAYAERLVPEAAALDVDLGQARFDDDDWDGKLAVLLEDPPAAVSFTFGCPPGPVIRRFHDAGAEVWSTITTPEEAKTAESAGADVLVAQGSEAGGHRATWRDDDPYIRGIGLLALVQLVRAHTAAPVVAAGGVATGRGIAATLAVGAAAAAVGSGFMLCPEAGTAEVHRAALAGDAPTALTRAFTGRMARGIRNRLLDELTDVAPSGYPEIHHLTAPIRQAGREARASDVVNLWAGEAYQLAAAAPAASVVARLVDELAAVS
jgi:nitronate monooxygenase